MDSRIVVVCATIVAIVAAVMLAQEYPADAQALIKQRVENDSLLDYYRDTYERGQDLERKLRQLSDPEGERHEIYDRIVFIRLRQVPANMEVYEVPNPSPPAEPPGHRRRM